MYGSPPRTPSGNHHGYYNNIDAMYPDTTAMKQWQNRQLDTGRQFEQHQRMRTGDGWQSTTASK